MLAYLLLAVAQTVGLVLVGIGAPGTWVQFVAITLFGWSGDFALIREAHVYVLLLLTVSAELFVVMITRRQGERTPRRASLLALVAAVVGVAAGSMVPLVGPVFGALAGAALGATVGVLSGRGARTHLPHRLTAVTVRTTASVTIAVFTLLLLY